jgi:hypothetical protein
MVVVGGAQPSGAQLKSYKAHGRTHRCLLRAGSKMAMDDWFYAINYSAHSLQVFPPHTTPPRHRTRTHDTRDTTHAM